MENPYHQSKIYKITNPHTDKIYIGSTIQKRLSQRFQTHRQDYKKWKSGKDRKHANSCFIFDASDNIFDTKVELIEEFKCESKKELWFREMEIINQYENSVNHCKGQTLDANYKRNNFLKNKDKYNEARRKKRQENLEDFRKKEKERYRKYRIKQTAN